MSRLCQYTTKFVNTILHTYYTKYANGGIGVVEIIIKLRELEQYFISCRQVLNFGRCTDQFYMALKTLQIYDPVTRMSLFTSKFWQSFYMFSDHVLFLNRIGFLKVDKQKWVERANKFWFYSISMNIVRDLYELTCVIQQIRTSEKYKLESSFKNLTLSSPYKWAKKYPKLSCDLIKNFCDFWIPYCSVNKIDVHPGVISMLGIISTTMGILQIYSVDYKLKPS